MVSDVRAFGSRRSGVEGRDGHEEDDEHGANRAQVLRQDIQRIKEELDALNSRRNARTSLHKTPATSAPAQSHHQNHTTTARAMADWLTTIADVLAIITYIITIIEKGLTELEEGRRPNDNDDDDDGNDNDKNDDELRAEAARKKGDSRPPKP
ncbi:hypothetical protein FMUND_9309 [Fusarium mundagurra]|uniref:Uncharacterized protein n=1 Tax=Fusarium mundagurra TaxID=1567541 RepID=A0A8H5YE53_9HYPO|nr:hypothetical protein FMUND_9309 [Fusarium mundagurra]